MACVDDDDNELIVLETIHHFVEVRARVCSSASPARSCPHPRPRPRMGWRCRRRVVVLRSPSQVLDRYFGNVCELDLIFNFHKAYHILDELLITGARDPMPSRALTRPLSPSRGGCAVARLTGTHASPRLLRFAGELQEPSKKAILRVTAAQDALMEGSGDSKVSDSKYEI